MGVAREGAARPTPQTSPTLNNAAALRRRREKQRKADLVPAQEADLP